MSDNKKFPPGSDPDATVSGPIGRPKDDPDATVSGPLRPPAKDDPEATVSGPLKPPAEQELDFDLSEGGPPIRDPEQTMTLRDLPFAKKAATATPASAPAAKPKPEDDPDATFSGPIARFDPDATISGSGTRRRNPFAPKALPEALQANLAALGGLNPLIAFANPIFSAVPQIAAARSHPDPALLKETLQDLIEAFEAGASKAGVSDETLDAAVFALCCLCDDAAASTPWGKDWVGNGLLKEMRGAANGGEEFFVLVEEKTAKPEENADLLEFLYVCLTLGFQGRYRTAEGSDAADLVRIRSGLHAVVAKRRGRPSGLSERWKPTRSLPATRRDERAGPIPWRFILAPVSALVVLFIGYKVFESTGKPAEPPVASSPPTAAVAPATPPAASTPVVPAAPSSTTATTAPAPVAPVVAPTGAPAPTVSPAPASDATLEAALASEARSGALTLSNARGRTTINFSDEHHFGLGAVEPSASLKALVERIAPALDKAPGPIVVRGYTDSVPVKPGAFASNAELSGVRAKAVAALLAAKLSRPERVTSEGVGEADPLAPNDSDEHRGRNRRVAIVVGPAK